jgi:acetyltransferase-like isoleucine patch superfamily enzyme
MARDGWRNILSTTNLSHFWCSRQWLTSQFLSPERLTLGNHVRIDPFCILSATGEIKIGSYVHISARCSLVGEAGIEVEDFVNISHGAKIFSVSDAGRGYLIGPMVPAKLRNVTRGRVHLMRYAVVGAGALVMPGVTHGRGQRDRCAFFRSQEFPSLDDLVRTPGPPDQDAKSRFCPAGGAAHRIRRRSRAVGAPDLHAER